jgi:catalase
VAGTLDLTGPTDEGDDFASDPPVLPTGIELSEDPVLRLRPRAYAISHARRTPLTDGEALGSPTPKADA